MFPANAENIAPIIKATTIKYVLSIKKATPAKTILAPTTNIANNLYSAFKKAKTSLPNALKVSFGGGTVMGLGVAGLAVLGLTAFFIGFYHIFMGGQWTSTDDMTVVLEALAGFSLGAESIALFARVGGGIYTKAADVGADLAGKVQADIPEDDPRNF